MVHWTCFLLAKRRTVAKYSEVTCVGDNDPEIKMDVKVSAGHVVNDVGNVEKSISKHKMKRIIVLIYQR